MREFGGDHKERPRGALGDGLDETYTEKPPTDASDLSGGEIAGPFAWNANCADALRMAGFRHEPLYDQNVGDTGETRIMEDRLCTELTILGDAGYAETSLTLWVSPREDTGGSAEPKRIVSNQIRSISIRKLMHEQLAKRCYPILMYLEEKTEPAITPTSMCRIRIRTLESVPVPAGQFELPAGIGKSAQQQ